MIDHLTLTVSDLARSKEFYTRAFEPLGYSIVMDFGEMVGFGEAGNASLWLRVAPSGAQPTHIAFGARSHAAVDAFHAAALEAGAQDNGGPGPRAHYSPDYYGAFVIDLDGHPIEAVCRMSAEDLAGKKVTAKAGAARKASAKKKVKKSVSNKSAKKKGAPKKKASAKRKPASKKKR
jgi:catechol 2,3-dioxygenase-like lactoylglutathione lyase family enzyme